MRSDTSPLEQGGTDGRCRSRLLDLNATLLRWHGDVPDLAFEAVQRWLLATLQTALRYDGALWAATGTAQGIGSAVLHGTGCDVLLQWLHDPAAALADAAGAADAAVSLHRDAHALVARPAGQLIVLARGPAGAGWTGADADDFALLAPHLVLADANRRRHLLAAARAGQRRGSSAAATVDGAGVVHDGDVRFLALLRREWADWPGRQLPPAVQSLLTRRRDPRLRFLGQQVVADFALVRDGLYLMTARARHASDVLTARESAVALRYAGGETFRAIADAMQLAPTTVRSHIRNVFSKLGVRNKLQLAAALR